MAKLKGQELVIRQCKALGHPATGDYATLALKTINEAQQAIDQLGSLSHLKVDTNLTLTSGLDYIEIGALSPMIDTGKQATLRLPGGRKGAVSFLAPDQMLVTPMDEYKAWNTDRPSYWTWGSSTAGALRIIFDRVNGSGGNLSYPFTYQRVSAAIVNDGSSESSLPEGYEITLLLPYAEMTEKRRLGKHGWKEIHLMLFGGDEKQLGGRLGRFLDQFGARKEEPRPDREQLERAQASNLPEGT